MNQTVYRDAITIVLLCFVVFVIWMLQHLNPPVDADKMDPPGNLIASIVWPDGNTDVDLWVTGPGEPTPVGYSNKGGLLWNLLRDDLGSTVDIMPLNFEHAFSRGMPPGDYRVNVQCYRCPVLPVEVVLEVGQKTHSDGRLEVIGTSTIILNRNTEEKTGLAFRIDDRGAVVPGSLNAIFAPLRSGKK